MCQKLVTLPMDCMVDSTLKNRTGQCNLKFRFWTHCVHRATYQSPPPARYHYINLAAELVAACCTDGSYNFINLLAKLTEQMAEELQLETLFFDPIERVSNRLYCPVLRTASKIWNYSLCTVESKQQTMSDTICRRSSAWALIIHSLAAKIG